MLALEPQYEMVTLEQYESLSDDVRAEVFDGQIFYMSSQTQVHQAILLTISRET